MGPEPEAATKAALGGHLEDWSGKSVEHLTRIAETRPLWYSSVTDFMAPRRSDGHGKR